MNKMFINNRIKPLNNLITYRYMRHFSSNNAVIVDIKPKFNSNTKNEYTLRDKIENLEIRCIYNSFSIQK